ncbi:MAG: HAD family hydrolase [Huintestinicola sp.]
MIRFIAADLDGTLLDSNKNLPEGFLDLVRRMKKLGITFAAASGRQYYGVEMVFEPVKDDMMFIAENGGAAFEHGKCIYSLPMENEDVIRIAEAAEKLYDKGVRVLLSGEKCAYVKDSDAEFARNCRMYCARLETIDDLRKFPDDDRIIKVAIFDMNAEKLTYPEMKRFDDKYNVILSNTCWVDIVGKNVNKGEAVDRLLKKLGIASEEAMCFGDYLNDLEMMSVCGHSFAMENGHPLLKKAARNIAPSNDDNGVVREILKAVPQLMTEE